MNSVKKTGMLFLFAITMATSQFWGAEVRAQSSYYTSMGCVDCHNTTSTCNGCHAHGTHSSSAKSDVNIKGTTSKTAYAPGETVSVTIAGGYRNGWVRAVLLDQNQVELARSAGPDSGMGSSTTFPAVLTAPAPTASGTYTWKVAWYGNEYDKSGASFGAQWVPDPSNPNHGMQVVSTNSFTVGSPADTTAPVVSAFTLPATATGLTVPVTALAATDNVAVTGYLVTTSATAPAASATGWSATAPASVTAAAAGSATFYGWAKDAAGNVSLSKSATVIITLPDTAAPVVTTFTLPATATGTVVPVTALAATDNVAVTGYLVTTSATAPAASAAGWSAAGPASVTAAASGSTTFYAWAKDAAGNVSFAKTATVTVASADTTNPLLSVSALADGAYTNKVTLNISGTASDAGGLDSVTVNGQIVAVNPDGAFSTALALVPGANTVAVIAKDKAGNQQTDTRIVTYDPAAPILTIASPADNSTAAQSLVTLNGTVNESSSVSVSVNNGSPQAAVINGSTFTAAVYLAPGVNTINITATDLAGNITSAKRTVTYASTQQLSLAVTYPVQDITTKQSILTLKGTVEDGLGSKVTVKITMNGRTYTPSISNGAFQQRLVFTTAKLYAITITATDDAGNTSTVLRNVIYRPSKKDRSYRDYDDD